MATQYNTENKGALFTQQEKKGEGSPDLSGVLDVNGISHYLSGWRKTSKKGVSYLSLSITPKHQPGSDEPPTNNTASNNFIF